MSARQLFNGIAVLIDDQFGEEGSEINEIAKQIADAGGHVIGLKALPNEDQIKNLQGVSFFVVDWTLYATTETDEHGQISRIQLPKGFQKSEVEKTKRFLTDLRSKRFAPVFVFTNEPTDAVVNHLASDKSLYAKGEPSHIFVKSKREVLDTGVFNVLTTWIEETPSALALKRWEYEYEVAKNQLFEEFHSKSIYWPAVLWQTFESDGVPPSVELGTLISRNLFARMTPFGMDMKPFMPKVDQSRREDPDAYREILRKVLEAERFIANAGLHTESVAPGDVFKRKGAYWINIRPDCDCIARGEEAEPDLYLLKGSKMGPSELNRSLQRDRGVMTERDDECIVFQMHNGVTVSFKFKDLYQEKWSEIKGDRFGRLIPPFSTRLQQRYAAYLQRPGLPKIPLAVMPDDIAAPIVALPPATLNGSAGAAAPRALLIDLASPATSPPPAISPSEGQAPAA